MTNEQKAQFLDLAARNLDLLNGAYTDLQWKYFGRIVASGLIIPQAILDSLSGVPAAVRTSLRQAGLAIATLTDMAPLVPHGGPPHGTPESWVVAWVDLADSTEKMIRQANQTLNRTQAFNAMMETWRRFGEVIAKGLGGAGDAAKSLGGAAMVIGVLLLVREFRRK